MIKGEKIRLDIHNILYSIYKFNKTLNNKDIQKKINGNKKEDISLLNNVTLNSMNYELLQSKNFNYYNRAYVGHRPLPGRPAFSHSGSW